MKKPPINTELKILRSTDKKLSPGQISFNKLQKQIDELEKEIARSEQKLIRLHAHYQREVVSKREENARKFVDLAKLFSKISSEIKLTKKQRESVSNVILELFDIAFVDIEPDEDTQAHYNRWSETTYKEEQELDEMASKELLSNILMELDLDVDVSSYDNSEESQARMYAHIKEKIDEKKDGQSEAFNKRKVNKTTQKQRDEQALQLKSLRSIYISLVKVFHPDTELDPNLKLKKEIYQIFLFFYWAKLSLKNIKKQILPEDFY